MYAGNSMAHQWLPGPAPVSRWHACSLTTGQNQGFITPTCLGNQAHAQCLFFTQHTAMVFTAFFFFFILLYTYKAQNSFYFKLLKVGELF